MARVVTGESAALTDSTTRRTASSNHAGSPTNFALRRRSCSATLRVQAACMISPSGTVDTHSVRRIA